MRRLRKTEAQIWDRSTTEHEANLFKCGQKLEAYPLAAAFRDQQKVFERLQRRISAAERSLRASLETLARLRKAAVAPAVQVAPAVRVGPAILSPAKVGQALSLSPANASTHSDPPSTLPQPSQIKTTYPNLALFLNFIPKPVQPRSGRRPTPPRPKRPSPRRHNEMGQADSRPKFWPTKPPLTPL